jgi:hypothetical protein
MAIDPGDMWTGYATLKIGSSKYYAHMGVLRNGELGFKDLVDTLIPAKDKHPEYTIIVESYQFRMQGFNRYSKGDTPRLIGGLQYASLAAGWHWSEVPPKDPTERTLNEFGIGRYLDRWTEFYPNPGDNRWIHARSAWRVMCQYLLTRGTHELSKLRTKTIPPLRPCEPILHGFVSRNELMAPSVCWEILD